MRTFVKPFFIVGTPQEIEIQLDEMSYACPLCKDTGYVTKIEWVGTDDSYEVEKRCVCNED